MATPQVPAGRVTATVAELPELISGLTAQTIVTADGTPGMAYARPGDAYPCVVLVVAGASSALYVGDGKSRPTAVGANGLPSGGSVGQVVTNTAPGVGTWQTPAAPAGAPVVRKFPIAFDTANLVTGHTIYTPTIGDVLLDAWFEIDTAWDGMTPFGDIGTFVGVAFGLFGNLWAPVSMDVADTEGPGTGTLNNSNTTPGGTLLSTANVGIAATPNLARLARSAPLKFTAANPVKVCVSQDGQNNGISPGATVGAAVVYLVTATPV